MPHPTSRRCWYTRDSHLTTLTQSNVVGFLLSSRLADGFRAVSSAESADRIRWSQGFGSGLSLRGTGTGTGTRTGGSRVLTAGLTLLGADRSCRTTASTSFRWM